VAVLREGDDLDFGAAKVDAKSQHIVLIILQTRKTRATLARSSRSLHDSDVATRDYLYDLNRQLLIRATLCVLTRVLAFPV
jgi:hypothetical protein